MSFASETFLTAGQKQTIVCSSLEQTQELADQIAQNLQTGDVVALSGELGAGKSTLIRMIVRALGYQGVISSPTFTLMNVYESADKSPIYHFDFYRVSSADEAGGFGADEFIGADGIAFIEWADKIPELLPENYYRIQIDIPDFGGSPTVRSFEISKR